MDYQHNNNSNQSEFDKMIDACIQYFDDDDPGAMTKDEKDNIVKAFEIAGYQNRSQIKNKLTPSQKIMDSIIAACEKEENKKKQVLTCCGLCVF